MHLHGIAWWDEHHKKVKLGKASVNEYRIRRTEGGAAASEADGGVLPPPMPNTSMKYPGEARGLFGVAMIKNADDSYTGKKAEPFNYTGCQVISMAQYEAECEAEMQRVRALKTKVSLYAGMSPAYLYTPVACSQKWDYKTKYPGTWQEELRRKLRTLKRISVRELIDHVLAQSTAMYAGTALADKFIVFHDALSAWWTPEAQAYIKSKGFEHRQLRCLPPTCVGTRYANKLPGDSPEICRGLDSFGFAHLARALALHTAITTVLPPADERRFNMGTADEVWRSLTRCWQVAPTSVQICADILGLPGVLRKIIAAEGCVVHDEFLRTGRRARSSDGSRLLESRLRPRQRKATIASVEFHPDSVPAVALLDGGGLKAMKAGLAAMADVEYEYADDDAAMTRPPGPE